MEENTKGLLIFKLFVGRLPRVKAEEYLIKFNNNIKENLKLPDYIKLLSIATFDENTTVEYIKFEENEFDKTVIDKYIMENTKTIEVVEKNNKDQLINVRISLEEKEKLLQKAESLGLKSLSEYLRFVGLNTVVDVKIKEDV